jgi:hypothetical protein
MTTCLDESDRGNGGLEASDRLGRACGLQRADLGTLLWVLWDGTVRPRLIRRDIIDRAAAAMWPGMASGPNRWP